jgi:hypothetical protein
MACSKIFSGELPELLGEIIQYFRSDFSTLYSCILVNRLCCRLTIPLLWENPFSITPNNEYHKIQFIETYLVNLNDNDKIKLNEFGKNHLSLSYTLFNYPSFIQFMDTHLICDCIKNWVLAIKENEELLFLFDKNTDDLEFIKFEKFIYKSLIKMFIESEASLYTFVVKHRHKYFDIVTELVLQSPNFIYNIKNLYIESYFFERGDINLYLLLEFLNFNCNSISSLYFPSFYEDNTTTIEYLTKLFESQKNPRKIFFNYNFPHSILLNSNCLNTLNTIIFYNINFKNINVLNEVFEQLNVLESIHIFYCRSLDSNFVQQIINITKPFKLKSLFMNEMIESVELLLQKSGDYLENFGFRSFKIDGYYGAEPKSELQILELITRYCTKIKLFELIEFNYQNIYSAFSLIANIRQILNYITIDLDCNELYPNYRGYNHDKVSPIVLQNLGQCLPFKLEYLNLSLIMNTNDLEIFLKKSQNTFIKKLLFGNILDGQEEDNMLHTNIKEHIMKKKRVKYFAFKSLYAGGYDHKELYYLKDEVKEFRLNNIIVKKYDDLKIDDKKLIGNLMNIY